MNKIYFKLARYFIFLIITTCLASTVLFFLTLGLPMTRDFHRVVRKQVMYVSQLTGSLIDRHASETELNHFLSITANGYEAQLALLDKDLKIIAQSNVREDTAFSVTDKMLSDIRNKGSFVQPNHMGKPLIYVVPVASAGKEIHYLLLYKKYSMVKQAAVFLIGLVLLCFLLILAIYPLAKEFTRPITQLTTAVHDIAAGKFDPDIKVSNRKDELGELLRVFRDMSRSVDSMIETKKILLADISHELRSPLGRMSIAAELIRESCASSDVDTYIENLEYEIDYMDMLIKQLAVYSTMNLPNFQLHTEKFSPCDMINDVAGHYHPIMQKKGIIFSLIPCETASTIEADRAKITQVLNNLLDNAMNACTPQGTITIGYTESTGRLIFSVTNTGPEIPENLREKIFTPLFRTDPSRSRKTGGLGLGLAISKRIIKRHGGTISCNCKDGITRFIFTLNTTYTPSPKPS